MVGIGRQCQRQEPSPLDRLPEAELHHAEQEVILGLQGSRVETVIDILCHTMAAQSDRRAGQSSPSFRMMLDDPEMLLG